jgi:hypothetical protein
MQLYANFDTLFSQSVDITLYTAQPGRRCSVTSCRAVYYLTLSQFKLMALISSIERPVALAIMSLYIVPRNIYHYVYHKLQFVDH